MEIQSWQPFICKIAIKRSRWEKKKSTVTTKKIYSAKNERKNGVYSSSVIVWYHHNHYIHVDVCSTDFHRVSLQLLSKPLSTHTRFNEDRILSKPPFYMILPFVFFLFQHSALLSFIFLFFRNVVIFVVVAVVRLHFLSSSSSLLLSAYIDDGFFFLPFVMYRTRMMRFL